MAGERASRLLSVRDASVRATADSMRRAAIARMRQLTRASRDAGNVIRRQQLDYLRSGARGPSVRPEAERLTKRKGGGLVWKTGSALLAHHRVVVRRALVAAVNRWEVFVGPTPGGPAFYGKFHELGVGPRTTKAGKSRGMLIADPWMHPAYEAQADRVTEIYARANSEVFAR